MTTIRDLDHDWQQLGIIEELTGALEGIASYRIRQVRDRVLLSKQFFNELWGIYQSLRVEKPATKERTDQTRNLFIVITSTSGLSGDIDEAIVQRVLTDYVASDTDCIVIGARGTTLLRAHGIKPVHTFSQPDISQPIDTSAVVQYMPNYRATYVYYQEFQSLMVQQVQKTKLILEAQALQREEMTQMNRDNLILAADYLFEPTEANVVGYLEHVMLGVALTQMILDSQLAQFAARFTSMLAANSRAHDTKREALLRLLAAKRQKRDESAHEIVYAMGGLR